MRRKLSTNASYASTASRKDNAVLPEVFVSLIVAGIRATSSVTALPDPLVLELVLLDLLELVALSALQGRVDLPAIPAQPDPRVPWDSRVP